MLTVAVGILKIATSQVLNVMQSNTEDGKTGGPKTRSVQRRLKSNAVNVNHFYDVVRGENQ